MGLRDELVMQVPNGALKQLIKNEQLEAQVKLSSSEEMAEGIATHSPDAGKNLLDEFKFAGATAVNVHMIMSGIPAV